MDYDVIVIGGGHAGCEAAHAAARLGCSTLMLAVNLDTIGAMPCNPAVGGPGKSQLTREVDAMGGIMGLAADATYLQMRMLNLSRGPAVQSLRAQSDKREYAAWMKRFMESVPNLTLRQGMVTGFLTHNNRITGVQLAFGETLQARAIILCAGTFLEGTIWIGKETMPAGRAGEFPAVGLSGYLKALGFKMERLKTGTPPRIDGRTIDYSALPVVPGDEPLSFFSFLDNRPGREQLPCHQTRTTLKTHEIIMANLQESPMYSGMIHGRGPRYCPSIEDKVVRFADKDSHMFFLEPEGRNTTEVYLQGCSTSLPVSVQHQIVHSLPGLENAAIIRYAYAVEYDYLPATQFTHALMSKELEGFFAAGQMLGTSGYEEAAGQGIIAGINATRYVHGEESLVLPRSSSYIGTLIDDLVTKEIGEPYRMMTSRSEYRLLLRQDNADTRLTPIGREVGLVDDYRWALFQKKMEALTTEEQRLAQIRVYPRAITGGVRNNNSNADKASMDYGASDSGNSLDISGNGISNCSISNSTGNQRNSDDFMSDGNGRSTEILNCSEVVSCVTSLDEMLAQHGEELRQPTTLQELLRRPRIPYAAIRKLSPPAPDFTYDLEIETQIKYAGYIERQKNHVAQTEKLDSVKLPTELDYNALENLSKEAREKLSRIRPETLGQAARIGGVSPADTSVLLVWLETQRRCAAKSCSDSSVVYTTVDSGASRKQTSTGIIVA